MPSYNLIDEPWIPCVMPDGRTTPKSIRDTLLQAHDIVEIYDDSPLVTVALHRLLLAILYRAWDLRKEEEWADLWRDLWPEGRFPPGVLNAYLDRWHDRFDLFSDTYPFYQVPHMSTTSASSVDRLILETQNSHFYHRPPDGVRVEPAMAARLILALQGFAIGFGRSSDALFPDSALRRPYSKDGILLRGVTLWLTGTDLFRTLMLNLCPVDMPEKSQPAWEYEPGDYPFDAFEGNIRSSEPCQGTTDRLTWLSRMVRLEPAALKDSDEISLLYFTQGRSEEEKDRVPDQMKPYRRSDEQGESPLALSEDRAIWRDYSALLATTDRGFRRVLALDWASYIQGIGELPMGEISIHVAGMATAPNKAAKLQLWRHDRIPLPAAILADENAVALLETLLYKAEDVGTKDQKPWERGMARQLVERFRDVVRQFLVPNAGEPNVPAPNPDDVNKIVAALDPRRAYWARLEGHFHRLVAAVTGDKVAAAAEWFDAIEREAETAYREACAGLGRSALAIQAVARYPITFRAPGRPAASTIPSLNETRQEVPA